MKKILLITTWILFFTCGCSVQTTTIITNVTDSETTTSEVITTTSEMEITTSETITTTSILETTTSDLITNTTIIETTIELINTYIFEAEYFEITSLIPDGCEYNCDYVYQMIVEDDFDSDASNGYFLGDLYTEGMSVKYEINSNEAIEDAELVLRLSAELLDITLTSDSFSIFVNEVKIEYDDIVFQGVYPYPYYLGELLPFKDYIIGNIALQEGLNMIELVVTNSDSMGGTLEATAPLIDCIKINTSAILTWEPHIENIDNIPGGY